MSDACAVFVVTTELSRMSQRNSSLKLTCPQHQQAGFCARSDQGQPSQMGASEPSMPQHQGRYGNSPHYSARVDAYLSLDVDEVDWVCCRGID